MMTSNQTNKQIKQILDKHLSHEQQLKMFTELSEVKGNKSFKGSIENLLKLIGERKTK